MCTLFNIKTGGCSEDCSYCAQSSRYDTGLKATKLSSVDSVLEAARIAKENGSSRFCMGAAWTRPKDRDIDDDDDIVVVADEEHRGVPVL